jgi:hypothetical protein
MCVPMLLPPFAKSEILTEEIIYLPLSHACLFEKLVLWVIVETTHLQIANYIKQLMNPTGTSNISIINL